MLSAVRFPFLESSLRFSAAAFSTVPDFKDPIKDQAEALVARKASEAKKGRVQSWRKPIYTAPHQHVFEQTPDFSFKDGRTIHVTSQKQLNYKLDQIRLAKKMVALLKETEDVEEVYKREQEARERREAEKIARRPIAKGNLNIN
ncbi:Large ribosomal subunit protein mL52 [Caenorhabditis elegans]|uniref:Large ribosomal subunit protein mL52 n=1 Tax=Caenorhabditis elegans TaxID=6239 RepID=Q9U1P7_CAEEL|nr:Large ribosomal subunit protein mL52 [Caenorhabditis elegans]CAB60435.1 Large ribosomal subunit protein mL52 [Caenorhabditis elegans]|eukprot:NP_492852.1 Uncharacterized protein CELE_Y95D11A.1 [Caenorhabditis elegans]